MKDMGISIDVEKGQVCRSPHGTLGGRPLHMFRTGKMLINLAESLTILGTQAFPALLETPPILCEYSSVNWSRNL